MKTEMKSFQLIIDVTLYNLYNLRRSGKKHNKMEQNIYVHKVVCNIFSFYAWLTLSRDQVVFVEVIIIIIVIKRRMTNKNAGND